VTRVAGLLLAAGAGRRLGTPKALVELDGSTLVERGAALLVEGGCDPVVVVLGAAAEHVQAFLTGVDVVVAPDWEEGMAASLRAGLRALESSAAVACVVALVDQPLVGVAAVRRLVDVGGAVEAAVATYRGEPRNPVLLGRSVWPELLALTGDTGARGWLRSHPDRVLSVACDDTGSPDDIDGPADLAAVRALLSAPARTSAGP
jgi:CTP:molybdopterin cytidylyltransferase MocA